MTNPLDTRPEVVAMVGLGPSYYDYISAAGCKKDFLAPDEVWGVNSTLEVLRLDKCFIMDDLKTVAKRFPQWGARITTSPVPVITCKQHPEFPNSYAYPIDKVAADIKDDYYTTTVAYMVAYAIHIKVKEIYLYGMDFWYPNSQAREPGAEAVCYLLGIAKERGINFKIPQSSTLMDANLAQLGDDGKVSRPLYGFDYNPGQSLQRVQEGRGTKLDHQVATKAPHAIPPTVKPDGKGESDGVHA